MGGDFKSYLSYLYMYVDVRKVRASVSAPQKLVFIETRNVP